METGRLLTGSVKSDLFFEPVGGIDRKPAVKYERSGGQDDEHFIAYNGSW